VDEPAFPDSDDDLFPVCGPTRAGVLHTDEYGVVYGCDRVPGLGWVWVSLGRAARGSRPGRAGRREQ